MKNTTEHESSAEHIRNPDVAHETSDISARGVYGFLIGLAIVALIVHVLLWGMFRYLRAGSVERDPDPNPMVSGRANLPPQAEAIGDFPEPRLQPNPRADMQKFRMQELQRLNSYGWVDQNSGVVHIPIDRAISILAERGLPVRQPGAVPTSTASPTARPQPKQ